MAVLPSGVGAAFGTRADGERRVAREKTAAARRTFPAHLIVEGRRCVVVGGGRAAVRRVERLLEGGASVVVVAPRVEPRIQALAARGDVDLRMRAFEPSDAAGAAYVFSTVDRADVNRAVADAARAVAGPGPLVAAADDSWRAGDMVIPAGFDHGPLTVAVGSSGADSRAARRMRDVLQCFLAGAAGEGGETMGFPQTRLRRLRRTPALRRMLARPPLPPSRLIYPVFVTDGANRREPIPTLPGQARVSADLVVRELAAAAEAGVGAFLFFGVPERKHPDGAGSRDGDGLVPRALRFAAQAYPDAVLMTDVCLCAYTDHGHCGVLRDGEVDNDPSIEALGKMAVVHARAGAHVVAPSAMMDGQVRAIRSALDAANLHDTLIMSYSTKFSSALYGPFRDAAKSAPAFGDRRSYQAPYDDPDQAVRESLEDEREGADILMVKPAMFYLDVIRRVREATRLPIAAYHVSGEYAMLHAAAEKGCGELGPLVREAAVAMSRAGADFIIAYWAPEWRRHLG